MSKYLTFRSKLCRKAVPTLLYPSRKNQLAIRNSTYEVKQNSSNLENLGTKDCSIVGLDGSGLGNPSNFSSSNTNFFSTSKRLQPAPYARYTHSVWFHSRRRDHRNRVSYVFDLPMSSFQMPYHLACSTPLTHLAP